MELFREYGVIDSDGKINLYNKNQFLSRGAELPRTNIELVVLKRGGSFTHQQRKYYFRVMVPELQRCFRYYGNDWTKEETHQKLKEMFLFHEDYNEIDGTWVKTVRSLGSHGDVSFNDFQEFIEKIVRFASTMLDWAVPYPNEIFNSSDFTESQVLSLINNP